MHLTLKVSQGHGRRHWRDSIGHITTSYYWSLVTTSLSCAALFPRFYHSYRPTVYQTATCEVLKFRHGSRNYTSLTYALRFACKVTICLQCNSGVDPSVFWVFEHPHNFGRWCSPVSEHPQIFPENMRFLPANGVHLQSIYLLTWRLKQCLLLFTV